MPVIKVAPIQAIEGNTQENNSEDIEPTNKDDSAIYHFGIFIGPLLSLGIATLFLYVPRHNVLKQPEYWYEFHVVTILGFLPLFYSETILQG